MVLKVENLVKDFRKGFFRNKVNILKNVSFSAEKGEVFGVVGPNGAGKTTTFKCILGFIEPTSGKISVFDKPNHDYSIRKSIGYLPENPYFYEYLTGYELLRYMGSLHGIKGANLYKRIDYLFQKVNLTNFKNLQLRKYSKGMNQRIGIAQAIINDPELLILDEPMSGLDPIGRREVIDLILELKNEGKTVVLSSHILSDLEALCDRVCFIFGGKVVIEGSLFELLNKAGMKYEAIIRKNEDDLSSIKSIVNMEVLERDDYISLKFDEMQKTKVIEEINKSKMELISLHPLRRSLEDLYTKQTDVSNQ